MPTDGINQGHKKYRVLYSQRFNLQSYLEPTLFGVNIDHYDINQFSKYLFFYTKLDP